jgi:hypothetical protein
MHHGSSLPVERCPHCNVAKPHLASCHLFETQNDRKGTTRQWGVYNCRVCGGVVLAVSNVEILGNSRRAGAINAIWPALEAVHQTIPPRARTFLEQAIASIHAPAGAVMLAASSVDAMLKEKGLKTGTLNTRIKEAAATHLITAEMADWAHEVRLDANDQRHADEDAPLPSEADARKAIDFTTALAQFLFVLPARVAEGRDRA